MGVNRGEGELRKSQSERNLQSDANVKCIDLTCKDRNVVIFTCKIQMPLLVQQDLANSYNVLMFAREN